MLHSLTRYLYSRYRCYIFTIPGCFATRHFPTRHFTTRRFATSDFLLPRRFATKTFPYQDFSLLKLYPTKAFFYSKHFLTKEREIIFYCMYRTVLYWYYHIIYTIYILSILTNQSSIAADTSFKKSFMRAPLNVSTWLQRFFRFATFSLCLISLQLPESSASAISLINDCLLWL